MRATPRAWRARKRVIDAAIAAATDERGLLIVITGNGKGKSTSAFGTVARALGHGMKVGVVQFIKSRTDTGEEAFLGRQPGVEWHVTGDGFTWDTQNREQDIATAQRGWAIAARMLADPSYQLVVLDELTYLLSYGYLDSRHGARRAGAAAADAARHRHRARRVGRADRTGRHRVGHRRRETCVPCGGEGAARHRSVSAVIIL